MAIRLHHDDIVPVDSVSPGEDEEHATFFGEFYQHLLTSSWPSLMFQIAVTFFALNALFALAYYLTGGVEHARPGSFSDVFFFSIETMATIGYGQMAPISLAARILMSFEALTGLTGLALMTGLMFAKFSRPIARVRFSRYAVISKRDGVTSLMLRMANVRANQIVEAQVHLMLARAEVTAEGENAWRFYDLELSRERNATFRHSWTVIHPIRPGSPLHGSSPEALGATFTEIVVSMTGIDVAFMQTVYARHTYRASHIIWGARLADVLLREPNGEFVFDYRKFDTVIETAMPVWETPEH